MPPQPLMPMHDLKNVRAAAKANSLWAMTSYFNPAGYWHRLANYRIFRRRLTVPLVAVELAYGSEFELGEDDADILVQLRGRDVMWQKERLLNLALEALPDACDKVAWLDCDILFAEHDWADRVSELLGQFMIVQPFSTVYHLPRDHLPEDITERDGLVGQSSVAYAIRSGIPLHSILRRVVDRNRGRSAGFAWAARRELLDSHSFYDACIVGGGDSAFVFAACGHSEDVAHLHSMNRLQSSRYLEWASRLHATARGSISYVPGDVFHLWHGELANRLAGERHERLQAFAFDPYEDIALDRQGAWRWASPKPELHAHLRDYFSGRREDG